MLSSCDGAVELEGLKRAQGLGDVGALECARGMRVTLYIHD